MYNIIHIKIFNLFQLDKVIAEMQRIYSTTKLREWQSEPSPEESYNSTEKTIQLEPGNKVVYN